QAGTGLVVLPRLTADRASDGDVFSTDGSLALLPADPSDPSSPLIFVMKYGKGVVNGAWIRSRPGQVLAPDDTAPAWHSKVLSRTLVDREGNPVGRDMEFTSRITPALEAARRQVNDIRTFREYNPATRQYGPSQPMPSFMFGAETYWVMTHGRPGGLEAQLDDGTTHRHTGREHGEWLKRRASFQGLPEDAVRNEFACWAGTPTDALEEKPHGGARAPFVADPLAPRFEAAAQGVATSTGKAFGANLRRTGLVANNVGGKLAFGFIVLTDVGWGGGGVESWRRVEPMPSRAKLERLAVVAGLGGELETAERLVFALRRTLGDGIDHDSGYEALVEGIGALELMRRGDPLLRDFGPFTMDLFESAARAQRWSRTGDAGGPVAREDYLDVLVQAARQGPGTALTDFLPGMAALKQTAAELREMGETAVAGLAVRMLGLDGPQSVGDIERARVLWAMAKASAWIDTVPAGDLDRVAAKVLHGQGPRGAARQREELLTVAASAAAKGRDLYDERELAVVHLELSGAFGPATAVSTSDGRPGGRGWRGDSQLRSWDSGQVFTYVRHAQRDAVRWEGAAPLLGTGAGKFSPYLLDPGVSALSGHVEMVLGGVALQVPFDEVTLLASYDPDLVQAPLKRDLVLTVPHDDLRDGMARETGRITRTFSGPTTVSHRADGGSVLMATQVVPRRRFLGVSRSGKPRPMAELWRVTDPRDVIPSPPGTSDETDPTAQVTFKHAAPPSPASSVAVPAGTPSWPEIARGLEALRVQAGAPGPDVYRQALVSVLGPGVVRWPEYRRWYDLVVQLDDLRKASLDPVLRRGPLDLAEVARYVLSMAPGAEVEEQHYRDLLAALDGLSDQDTARLDRVGAVYLVNQGAFDRRYAVVAPNGVAYGRMWTPRSFGRGLDLSQTVIPRFKLLDEAVTPEIGPSPWSHLVPRDKLPYGLFSDGGADHVMVGGRDEARFHARTGVFAELLPMDPIMQAMEGQLPIVLFVKQAGVDEVVLPRRAADAADRAVFSVSGDLDFRPFKRKVQLAPWRASLSIATLIHREGMPIGEWIMSLPGQVLPPDDTTPAWQRTAVSRTLVDGKGNPIGRYTEPLKQTPADKENVPYPEIRYFRDYNPATRQLGPKQKLPSYMLKAAYWDIGHGIPGGALAGQPNGESHTHTGREHGQWLNRRASFRGRPEGTITNQVYCWVATPADSGQGFPHPGARAPFIADPLAPRFQAIAQGTADETRRGVGANTRVRAVGSRVLGTKYVFYIHTDVHWGSGGQASWRLVEPMPTRAELERVAVVAGLPGEPETAERLVFALRRTLGDGIDHDPDHQALVKGIGALELMRRNDPLLRGFGPFTMDLFQWAARAKRAAPGGSEPTRDEYLDVLALAARQGPGTRLTDFLPGTAASVLAATADELVAMGKAEVAGLAVRMLGLDGPQSVGDIERARVLWAMAKANAWIDTVPAGDLDRLSAKVLHGQGPRGAAQQREELLTVAASAAAKGRDLEDERELAVVHLELSGAFGPATAVSTSDGSTGGRGWRGDSQLRSWDPGQVFTYVRHAQENTVRWEGAAPLPGTGAGKPSPYLLDPGVSALSGHVEMVLGGVALQVPFDEVTLLASYDPDLVQAPLERNLVLTVPDDDLRDGMARETGRFTRTFSGPTGMLHQAGSGSVLMATQVVTRRRVLGVSRSAKPRPMAKLWRVTDPRDVIPSPPGTSDEPDSAAPPAPFAIGPQRPASSVAVPAGAPSWETIEQGLVQQRAQFGAPGVDAYEQALVDAFGPDVVHQPEYAKWYDLALRLNELRPGPLDLAEAARYVLSMKLGAEEDEQHYRDLLAALDGLSDQAPEPVRQAGDPYTSSGAPAAQQGVQGSGAPRHFTPAEALEDYFGPALRWEPGYPDILAAATRLDALRAADPYMHDRPLRLDSAAEYGLSLTSQTNAGTEHVTKLLELASGPLGTASRNLSELGARYLESVGVFDDRFLLSHANGNGYARNWTNERITDLDSSEVGVLDWGVRTKTRVADWVRLDGHTAYIVVSRGGTDNVEVQALDSTMHAARTHVFAALMRLEPLLKNLPKDVPGVLAVPYAGAGLLEVPRAAATSADRLFFAANGDVAVEEETSGDPHVISLRKINDNTPVGAWIPNPPGLTSMAALGGTQGDHDVKSHPIPPAGNVVGGRTAHSDGEVAAREWAYENPPDTYELTNGVTYEPVGNEMLLPVGPQERVYHRQDHGQPGFAFVQQTSGGATTYLTLKAPDYARHVARHPSLAALDEDGVILLDICWAATPSEESRPSNLQDTGRVPYVFNTLVTHPLAQYVSTEAERPTLAGTRVTAKFAPPHARSRQLHLLTDPRGGGSRLIRFRPEPKGAALEALAVIAGQTPEVTRQLVHALRQTFGHDIDPRTNNQTQDLGADEFRKLLEGIGALEGMRARDLQLRDFGPFTLYLLARAASAYRAQRGLPPAVLTNDDYRDLLLWARTADEQGLTALLPLQGLAKVGRRLQRMRATGALETTAVAVLRLSGLEPVSQEQIARLFWALAWTDEWVDSLLGPDDVAAAGQEILHLEPGAVLDPRELYTMVAMAAAAGRNYFDRAEVGAFHLETLGAFEPELEVHDGVGDKTIGRDWSGGTGPRSVNMSTFTKYVVDANNTSTSDVQRAPYTKLGHAPLLYRLEKAGPTHSVMKLRNRLLSVPNNHIGVLMSFDRFLMSENSQRDLVFEVDGREASQLVLQASWWTGRDGWRWPDRVRTVRSGTGGRGMISAFAYNPVPPGRHTGVYEWHRTRIADVSAALVADADRRIAAAAPAPVAAVDPGALATTPILRHSLFTQPEAPVRQALTQVFVDARVERQAPASEWFVVARELNELRMSHPELRKGPFDLAEVARFVLGLRPDAQLFASDYQELFKAASDEAAAGALNLDRVSAVYYRNQGVFNQASELIAPDGTRFGRTWASAPIDARRLDLSQVVLPGDVIGPAPWAHLVGAGERPYIVFTDGAKGFALLVGRGGMKYSARTGVFVELLSMDPILRAMPARLPMVVLADRPAGDVELPVRAADRAVHEAFSASGGVRELRPVRPGDPSSPLIIALRPGPHLPAGQWMHGTSGGGLVPRGTAPAWHSSVVNPADPGT
ncbi:lonely Cys domain-containing protein, partial [Streptomyces sp. NPDC048527]|uniref:lonely Cys domain-containing protein n=1 Tax=Streptomyces sp. NPDC048527 TaxID=3365568 RepID=UPI0037157DAA